MIAIRTYQCLDASEAESRRYLAVVAAPGIAMNFTGATALDAQARAKDWIDAQREKVKAGARAKTSRKEKP